MENNAAKFHPDPISNDRALGFLKRTNKKKKKKNNKMSSDMGSVSDFKGNQKLQNML